MAKQDKFTKSACNQLCQVRVPGVCNHNPETTVLAHINGFRAGGHKALNIHGAYACFNCHSWLDGGYIQSDVDKKDRDLIHLNAVIRTQIIMVEEGILVL